MSENITSNTTAPAEPVVQNGASRGDFGNLAALFTDDAPAPAQAQSAAKSAPTIAHSENKAAVQSAPTNPVNSRGRHAMASLTDIFKDGKLAEDDSKLAVGDDATRTEKAAPPAQNPHKEWSLESFLRDKIPDAPEFLRNDEKKIEQWRGMKELVSKTTAENRAIAMQLAEESKQAAQLRERLAALEQAAKIKTNIPEQAVASGDSAAAQHPDAEKARAELAQNIAFSAQYDGVRARILDEAHSIAEESGIEPAALKKIFALKSEYAMRRALAEETMDDTAAQMLLERGREFLRISGEKEKVLNAADPFVEVEKWRDMESVFDSQVAAQMGNRAHAAFVSAMDAVEHDIMQSAAQDDPYFASDAGKKSLASLRQRIEGKGAIHPREVLAALAKAEAVDTYAAYAAKLRAALIEAQGELAEWRAVKGGAGAVMVGNSGATAQHSGAEDIFGALLSGRQRKAFA